MQTKNYIGRDQDSAEITCSEWAVYLELDSCVEEKTVMVSIAGPSDDSLFELLFQAEMPIWLVKQMGWQAKVITDA